MLCDKIIKIFSLAGGMLLAQCKTENGEMQLNQSGILSTDSETNHSADEVVFLPETLSVSQTVRPKVELRIGPGSEFELLDQTLAINTGVVILESKDIWQKVFVPLQRVTGWTHVKSLALPKGNSDPCKFP